jgi:hypothetical protein
MSRLPCGVAKKAWLTSAVVSTDEKGRKVQKVYFSTNHNNHATWGTTTADVGLQLEQVVRRNKLLIAACSAVLLALGAGVWGQACGRPPKRRGPGFTRKRRPTPLS